MIFEECEIIRASQDDLKEVMKLYSLTHYKIESSTNYCGWQRNIYPTDALIKQALADETLFVARKQDKMVACVILNKKQPKEYMKARWPSLDIFGEALVVEALAVLPDMYKKSIGSTIVRFAELAARSMGLKHIRCDVYLRNTPAIRMLGKLGYVDAGEIESEKLGGRKWVKCFEKTY